MQKVVRLSFQMVRPSIATLQIVLHMLPKKLGLASIFRGTSNEQFGSFDSGCKEINTKNTML